MSSRAQGGTIGPQLVVRGKLDGKADLSVDGLLEADVELDGLLSVGPSGAVAGDVHVHSLIVEGELVGDVVASDLVAIRADGRIQGSVRAARVALDDGAVLHGEIDMNEEVL